ncbi:50S ribosomal protein L4 [bacterium]|nr:50S ribosomal protein L4 [candidate division CSSED10-310 bacterium]
MPKIDVKSVEGQVVGSVDLPDNIFAVEYNPHVIQEIIRMQTANKRRGTHKVKTRGEVTGSTRKPYRQKGTGRARMGTLKTPLRKGGGVIFGPQPRDYSFSPPKKVRRNALKVALSKTLADGFLEVIREFEVEQPKTKALVNRLDPGQDTPKTLIVLAEPQDNLRKSLRNVPNYKVLLTEGLNVYDLVNSRRVILMEKTIPLITKRLG